MWPWQEPSGPRCLRMFWTVPMYSSVFSLNEICFQNMFDIEYIQQYNDQQRPIRTCYRVHVKGFYRYSNLTIFIPTVNFYVQQCVCVCVGPTCFQLTSVAQYIFQIWKRHQFDAFSLRVPKMARIGALAQQDNAWAGLLMEFPTAPLGILMPGPGRWRLLRGDKCHKVCPRRKPRRWQSRNKEKLDMQLFYVFSLLIWGSCLGLAGRIVKWLLDYINWKQWWVFGRWRLWVLWVM